MHIKAFARMAAMAYALIITGCTAEFIEYPYPSGNTENKNAVSIVVTVPGAVLPSTSRMAEDAGEETVETIDVLVFDRASSPETLIEHVCATDIDKLSSSDGSYKVEFRAKLKTRETASRLVIIANAADEIATLALQEGEEKSAVMGKLRFVTTGTGEDRKWKADGSLDDGYTPIPMYAEKEVAHIKSGNQIDNIDLVRMLARIDVINNVTDDFTLTNIHLVNYNLSGFIAPAWNVETGLLLPTPTSPYIPGLNALPGSANTQTGKDNALSYTYIAGEDGKSYEGEIYTYESIAAIDGTEGDLGRKNATCVVLEGKITGDNTPYFYRVDFTRYQKSISDPSHIDYMPLFRNHKYIITIQAATGRGYTSLDKAINAYTVVSNLKTQIIAYDQSTIKNIVYDGQYMLGVEDNEVHISGDIQEFDVEIVTDITTGYIATIPGATDSWLTIVSGGSSSSEGSSTLRLKANTSNVGEPANRMATINIKAGRLSLDLIISQTTESKFKLKVTDVDGNEISELNFASTFIRDATVPSQTIVVEWEGVEECTITQAVDNYTPFQYDSTSDLPAGTISSTAIGATYSGYHKVFNIIASPNHAGQEQILDPVFTLTLTFKITDPVTMNAITKTLDINYKREYMFVSHNFIGAFWRWNQWGERLIRMKVNAGNWTATVIEGGDFIRLDTQTSSDPNIWRKGVIPTDMNLFDSRHRLSNTASTTISGTAIPSQNSIFGFAVNMQFRIGLTGAHPDGERAGEGGDAIPRYGKVKVTYNGGEQIIYIRQGEVAAAILDNQLHWPVFNLNDPSKGIGGEYITDHNEISMNDQTFNAKKFTEYPTQSGYLFQANRPRAFHPTNSETMVDWLATYSDMNPWTSTENDICPKGYRIPTGYRTNGNFHSGLSGSDGMNSLAGYYADGYFDRMHVDIFASIESQGGITGSVGSGNDIAYPGLLFYDDTTHANVFFPAPGYRHTNTGQLIYPAVYGIYWTSSSYSMLFQADYPGVNPGDGFTVNRAYACSIRCIKEMP